MKNSTKWLIGALALVVLMVGATVLYDSLSDKYDDGGLVTDVPRGNTTPAHGAGTPAPGGSSTTAPGGAAETPPAPNLTAAPDFTVVDGEGNKYKLSDLRGKPVVINFWATWCGWCKVEMPAFQQMYEKYGDRVQFMMVDMTDGQSETVAAGQKFISEQGYTFPVYFDTMYEAAYAYYVTSLPATYFVDAEGNLIAHRIGAIDAETLERGISFILGE